MDAADVRGTLARQIAGDIVTSDDPGGTIRKWREDFGVTQADLAGELEVSPSVVSDYESGRRPNPGVDLVRGFVDGLLGVDDRRGGHHIRQFARILSAGFESDVVMDLREYPAAVDIGRFFDVTGSTPLVEGTWDHVTGHTVIDSIAAIKQLSSEEFLHLYGQSTSRALVFTDISRGESPLVALRVVNPTPNAVVLHGIGADDLWEHAPTLARMDGYALGLSQAPLETVLEGLQDLP
ncbi:MAG: helix-turn-helix domain-containing protein [Halobacteriota archaeon]